jgi:threonine synthase
LVGVNGSYDDVNRLCSEIANEFEWAFVNINIRPYYAEGSKTLGFETIEQLGWQAPDNVVVPVASGSLLTKVHKGIHELNKTGLISKPETKISGAQAAGCAPIADAFKNNTYDIKPVKPDTIAKSLAIGNPADGYYALKTVRDTDGYLETATDDEIVEGVRLLAQTEGIFSETAGGVTVAALKKLAISGRIKSSERTVIYITGTGLKTTEVAEEEAAEPTIINPTVKAFKDGVLSSIS